MSWESSAMYYQRLNQLVAERLGGLHSAQCLMMSVDFAQVAQLQKAGDWEQAGALLVDAARKLERGGAEVLLICTNTMHKVAEAIESAVSVPLLHIADVSGQAVQAAGVKRVALLGTAFTMEQAFYRERLEQRFGLEVLTPPEADRAEIHRVIYDELCLGQILDSSRARFVSIIQALMAQGAEGVILGCTEIPLLVRPEDVAIPVFDTTALHAQAAVDFALQA